MLLADFRCLHCLVAVGVVRGAADPCFAAVAVAGLPLCIAFPIATDIFCGYNWHACKVGDVHRFSQSCRSSLAYDSAAILPVQRCRSDVLFPCSLSLLKCLTHSETYLHLSIRSCCCCCCCFLACVASIQHVMNSVHVILNGSFCSLTSCCCCCSHSLFVVKVAEKHLWTWWSHKPQFIQLYSKKTLHIVYTPRNHRESGPKMY